jgi:nucleoside phosphorylase
VNTFDLMQNDLAALQEWLPTLAPQQVRSDSALLNAVSILSAAALETRKVLARYQADSRKSVRGDPKLVALWHKASLSLIEVDRHLAARCLHKADFWADPKHWEEARHGQSSIALDDIFDEAIRLLSAAAAAPRNDDGIEPDVFASQNFGEEDLSRVTVGVLTALPKEFIAMKRVLTGGNEVVRRGTGAGRRYWITRARSRDGLTHIVAVAHLVSMGTNIGATRATQFFEHCPNLQSLLMVGIAGGVPIPQKAEDHVRLGDVVVSNEKGTIQYDYVKRTDTFEERRHSPRPPGAELLEAAVALHSTELEGERPWETYIAAAIGSLGWVRPSSSTDVLRTPGGRKVIPHPDDADRTAEQPKIFRGPIASSNTLLKAPALRDLLRDKYGVKAVEMEGSGIADAAWIHDRGYLVVRGICDYCDKSKGNEWQNYASIAAAAYARSILENLPVARARVVSPNNGPQHDAERLHDLVHEIDSRRVFYAIEEDLGYALKSVLDARKAMRKIARGLWQDPQAEAFAADLQRILSDFVTDIEPLNNKANSYHVFYERLLDMRKAVVEVVSQIVREYGQQIRVRNLVLGERD